MSNRRRFVPGDASVDEIIYGRDLDPPTYTEEDASRLVRQVRGGEERVSLLRACAL